MAADSREQEPRAESREPRPRSGEGRMIRGDRTNLRAVERGDDRLLHGWLNDPTVMAGWGLPDPAISMAEIQRRIEVFLGDEAALGRPTSLMVETLEGEAI